MRYRTDVRHPWHEAYFLTVADPIAGIGGWFRLTRGTGGTAPAAAQWAMLSLPGAPSPVVAHRKFFPAEAWHHAPDGTIAVAESALTLTGMRGAMGDDAATRVMWNLHWEPPASPVRCYPHAWMYRLPWPTTKYTIPGPALRCHGTITVGARQCTVRAAPGHVGHVWGSRMAGAWAWAQASSFDDGPGYFEALSARVPLGPLLSPPCTLVRFHCGATEYRCDAMSRWCRQQTAWDRHGWTLEAIDRNTRIRATIRVGESPVVGVTYHNPGGGRRYCYNTVMADGRFEVAERDARGWQTIAIRTSRRAVAYEHVSAAPDPQLPLHL